ncbi:DMT family transporter [Sorangium sp. So ce1014]|uniref:hypothetical protein n=1 Tax=Sorangium sp. So ce1014 TaxID=3133326 RepID=UPI003F63C699
MSLTATGILLILVYNLLSATKGVYLASLLQAYHPVLILVACFSLVALFFVALQAMSLRRLVGRVRSAVPDVIAVNLTTAGSWFSFYYALKFLEPAVVTSISASVGPLSTILLAKRLRPGKPATRAEIVSSVGILGAMFVLISGTWLGYSAVGAIDAPRAAVGIAATLLCGICVVGNTIFSKRLNDRAMDSRAVMAVRFFILIALGTLLLPTGSVAALTSPGTLPPIFLIAIFGVIIPLYALQVGIARCEPIVVALTLATAPLFVYAVQFFDARLHASPITLVGVALLTMFTAVGAIGGLRRSRGAAVSAQGATLPCAGRAGARRI